MAEKAFTTTTIIARLNYENEGREVGVTNGVRGISLWVGSHPKNILAGNSGVTNLTPEQARQLARDLVERADEIEQKGQGR